MVLNGLDIKNTAIYFIGIFEWFLKKLVIINSEFLCPNNYDTSNNWNSLNSLNGLNGLNGLDMKNIPVNFIGNFSNNLLKCNN